MEKKPDHCFNYYFLGNRLHPPAPTGYQPTLILLIINKNESVEKNKFVFVQHKNRVWGFPKGRVAGNSLLDSISEAIVRNLGEELGIKGLKVIETKTVFRQKAYIFDIARQVYDSQRAVSEREKEKPDKGKIYHLIIMEYQGADKLPFENRDPKEEIVDFRWVNKEEGIKFSQANLKLMQDENYDHSEGTLKFNLALSERVFMYYSLIYSLPSGKVLDQATLF